MTIETTIQAIATHFARQQSHVDEDNKHVTKTELLAAKGRISADADCVLDAILCKDNYVRLAKSKREGLFQSRTTLFGDPRLSILDLENPSSSAIRSLEKTLANNTKPPAVGESVLTMKDRELALSLMRIGGTATREDVEPVLREVLKLPREVLVALHMGGYCVVVCRNSVTDYMHHLKGVHPRCYPPSIAWDMLPGGCFGNNHCVVIATQEKDGHREVPSMDGVENLVFHECLHAYHFVTKANTSFDFVQAQKLDARDHVKQGIWEPGIVGLEESFAEIGSKYLCGIPTLCNSYPNLFKYFEANFTPKK